jgi:hypothetical protein
VVWKPNQAFEKSDRRGDVPQGKSPLPFDKLFFASFSADPQQKARHPPAGLFIALDSNQALFVCGEVAGSL